GGTQQIRVRRCDFLVIIIIISHIRCARLSSFSVPAVPRLVFGNIADSRSWYRGGLSSSSVSSSGNAVSLHAPTISDAAFADVDSESTAQVYALSVSKPHSNLPYA